MPGALALALRLLGGVVGKQQRREQLADEVTLLLSAQGRIRVVRGEVLVVGGKRGSLTVSGRRRRRRRVAAR